MNVFCDEVSYVTSDPWKPTPDNFDLYLPWACRQLQLGIDFNIVNVQAGQHADALKSKDSKNKPKAIPLQFESYTEPEKLNKKEANGAFNVNSISGFDLINIVKIQTIYDNTNLVQLKFDNNKRTPIKLLRVIELMLEFHVHLTSIIMNRGVNKGIINELNKWLLLPSSNITDIFIDNAAIDDGNYDIFLEKDSNLKQLSLSRCNIDDVVVCKIASKLAHPLPGSKTLSLLNLSSNKITDAGASAIAEALRTNRQLAYLNLADNSITDKGAVAILKKLVEFVISATELLESKRRMTHYWREKQKLLAQMMADQQAANINTSKRKPMKPLAMNFSTKKSKVIEKEPPYVKLDYNIDPFSRNNILSRDEKVHSYGNNCLSYLNLSYNNVGYLTVKWLLAVLLYQKKLNRKPRGLINVVIEGNAIPTKCVELDQIDDILRAVLPLSKPIPTGRRATTVGLR